MMALAAIVSFASCTSEDNETINNTGNTNVMTFTATQESNAPVSRAVISADDSRSINWEADDQISILDGATNNLFTLKEGEGTTSAKFEGTAANTSTYTAVYPYQSGATLSGTSVENIILPATQTATAGSFDKAAALMMAQSTTTALEFKNAVGYVKVTPKFDCSKMELKTAGATEYLAGKGTLTYNEGAPSIAFTSKRSATITLEGSIIANNTYYIAVPATTLSAGWSISFTNATDGKVYTRKGVKDIIFKRNTVTNLGKFATDDDFWYDAVRGIVKKDQEVDMGLKVKISGAMYKVIFAKNNLTATGLATKESDYGDYFAWGALEPWYTNVTTTSSSVTVNAWKDGKSEGYSYGNCPSNINNSYVKNGVLKIDYDAARQVLGGDWQLPTKVIWEALSNANKISVYWGADGKKELEYIDGIQGMKITKKGNNSTYLFLPAAGFLINTSSKDIGSYGYYRSGTAYSDTFAYCLDFSTGSFFPQSLYQRSYGCPIRPIRLVAVE